MTLKIPQMTIIRVIHAIIYVIKKVPLKSIISQKNIC
jgi:hypothetical protein